jgi:hypothetical protein
MHRLRRVTCQGRAPGLVVAALVGLLTVGAASCGPAADRPRSGAVPGADIRTPPGVPPTLAASDGLAQHASPGPSPGIAVSPSAPASPSVVAAPPIVRTIVPGTNGRVPAGAPVAVSAVLVGRGADLASASMSVNGADVGAQIDKRTAREWSIHTSQTLGVGNYTARVNVRDATGAAGGFTWQFLVGEEEDAPKPVVQASPVPKPASP